MEEATPPSLAPLNLVYKKSAVNDAKVATLGQESPVLMIGPALNTGSLSSDSLDSSLNLSTPLSATIRNRPGNEFTLVLKYRFAAESAAQKEHWLAKLSLLGIQASIEEDEAHATSKKEKDVKVKRSSRRIRTDSVDSDGSRLAAIPRTSEAEASPKPKKRTSSIRRSSDVITPADKSPISSPRSPGRNPRTTSPRVKIPSETSPRTISESSEECPIIPTTFAASAPMSTDSPLAASLRSLPFDSPLRAASETYHLSLDPSSVASSPHEQLELEPELPGTPPRLIRVHGARNNIHCSLVPRQCSSLNKFDCFILDDGSSTLFSWKGKAANMFTKSELQDVALAINQASYAGKSKIVSVQQALEPPAFWELLLNGKGEVAESDNTGITSIAKLFTIPIDAPTATAGNFALIEEGRSQLKPSLVSKEGVYALDTGFEIVIYNNLKEAGDGPVSEQELIDSARRYKAAKLRPQDVRITLTRGGSPRHPLFAHFLT